MKVSLIEVVGVYAVIGILIPGSPLLDMADSGLNLANISSLPFGTGWRPFPWPKPLALQ